MYHIWVADLDSPSYFVATAAVVLAETLPPAVIGVAFLGDKTRPGLEPAALAGFVIAVVSAVMLARFGDADHAVKPGHAAEAAAAGRPEDAGDMPGRCQVT